MNARTVAPQADNILAPANDAALAYRVQVSPRPIVIDDTGLPVPQSHVLTVGFPRESVDTQVGAMTSIVGAGTATILVGSKTILGVALC